jgi:uroporphyrinogen III methyltransferase/synthase
VTPPVIFVGAGPGDPGLITLRGFQALGQAQVVVADRGVPAALLEGLADSVERVWVGGGPDAAPPAAVPSLLAARAAAGRRVVRLLAGDGSDFAREADVLARERVRFEVVAGVTPAVAGAVCAGIPLTHAVVAAHAATFTREEATPIDWRRVGRAADTVAIRVTPSTLSRAVEGLIRGGRHPETAAALIVRTGSFAQTTITAPLRGLEAEARAAALDEPAVLVVGEVVGLRSRLRWLERRPLFARRVIVTRPRAQVPRFAALLEGYGAEVVAVPTIRIDPPDDPGPLDQAIGVLARFHWIVFTSANGVAAFGERLAAAGLDARALASARLAAIGPETAEALRPLGLSADLVPAEFRAEGLMAVLGPRVGPGTEVLLVRAAEARDVLPRELETLGARVTVAPAYRTVAAKEGADQVLALCEARRVDVVTFTSSSTVRAFLGLLPRDDTRRLLAGVALAAIGPITAGTLAEYGLAVSIMPREYTIPALAAAIAAHFAPPTTQED